MRLELYQKRKEYLEGQLSAEAAKLTNQARFILEKIEGKVVIGELILQLYHCELVSLKSVTSEMYIHRSEFHLKLFFFLGRATLHI